MKQGSQGGRPGSATKALLLTVLIPLFVTVLGGLLVEYLKPEQANAHPASPAYSGQQQPTQSEDDEQNANRHDSSGDKDLAAKALRVLRVHCARCHGSDSPGEGHINYILDPRQLVAKKKIRPGDAEHSRLLRRVVNGEMPPEDEKPRPTAEDIAVLRNWINTFRLTDPSPPAAPRPFVSTADNVRAMLEHLRRTPREARPLQRFFTLTHLHNDPRISERDLRLYRAALNKLLNSLSWKAALVLPEPVDEQNTVLAVDLRKLDWDTSDLWQEVLRLYPHGLRFDQYPDVNAERDAAREVYERCGTTLPAVRIDWFLATASQPPLYHTLLRLPNHAADLERQLRVNVAANLQRGEAVRAAFSNSGVSRQNRLVERHDAANGAYWKSYDFRSNDGDGNLFRLPLGPRFTGNSFDELAFVHAGGEIIFSLPNGLQGYLLVDGRDRRIDAAPLDVVRDKQETSGSVAVVNGLSCMACHQRGVIGDFQDQVRGGTNLGGAALDKVRQLYRPQREIERLLKQDEERFVTALERATGPYLRVGEDRKRAITDFPEAIGPLARRYLLAEIGLKEAAYELDLRDPQSLRETIRLNDRLGELGLRPLAAGGTIKREVWDSLNGHLFSASQQAAQVLKLGTPVRVRSEDAHKETIP